jgi:hypothetical protein
MKKQVLKIFSMLSLAVTLAVAAVYANPVRPLKANIPFDFSVENKTLPAGVYTVESMTTPSLLLIRRNDGRQGALIKTQGVQARREQDQTRLVFRRYGDHYFLAQVWTAGDSNGRELWKSRTERELIKSRSNDLAKNAVEPEVVCIVAQ